MKELAGTLNDAIITRIKSPFLGTLILCYLSLNIKGISAFYFGTSQERIVIVDNFNFFDFDNVASFFTSDFFNSFVFLIVYIAVAQFLFPMLQVAINYIKYQFVTKAHQIQQADEKQSYFEIVAEANEAKYRANDEYIKTKYDRGLDNWEKDEKEFKEEIERLKIELGTAEELANAQVELLANKDQRLSERMDEIIASKDEYQLLQENYIRLTKNNNKLKTTYHSLLAEVQLIPIDEASMSEKYGDLGDLKGELTGDLNEANFEVEQNEKHADINEANFEVEQAVKMVGNPLSNNAKWLEENE